MTDRPVPPHSKTKPPGRRAIRCLLLTTVALITACLIALVLVGGYIYRHPSSIKNLLAERISELTGVAVTVGELSYSVNPLHLGLRDVAARPAEDRPGFDLQLGSLVVDARLSGPFGRRTLVVEHLRAEDFSVRLNTDLRLPKALAEAASPSSMGRLIRRLIRFFLISDIEWSLLEANNGRLTITGEAMQLVLDGLRLKSDAADGIDARGRMVESRIGADTHVAVADCRIRLEPAVRTETGSLSGRLELSGGRIYGTSFSADDIAAAVRLIYQSDRNEIALSEMSIDGRLTAHPIATDTLHPVQRLSFTGRGAYRLAEEVLDLSGWSFDAAGLLMASGTARLDIEPPSRLRIELAAGRLDADRFGLWYNAVSGKRPLPLTVAGQIDLEGEVEGPLTVKGSGWRTNLRLMLQNVPVAYHDTDTRLQAVLSGGIQATGKLANPQLRLNLEADKMAITSRDVALTGFQPLLNASGHFPVLEVNLRTRGPGANLTAGSRRLAQVKIEWDRGQINLRSGEFSLPRIVLSSATLANLEGALTRTADHTLLKLQGRNSGLLPTAAALGLLPADWRFAAGDTLELTLKWQANDGGTLSGRIGLTEFGFSDPTESRLADNLTLAAETWARIGRDGHNIHSDIHLSAAAGEILWGAYYLNLGATPFTAAVVSKIRTDRAHLTLDRLETSLKDLIDLKASGSVEATAEDLKVDMTLQIPRTKAGPLYRHLIGEPYRYKKPALSDLRIEGHVGAQINVTAAARSLSAKGHAYWQQGLLDGSNMGLSLSGIDLGLPLWYRSTPSETAASPLKGHLKIARARLPHLGELPLMLEFDARPNHLTIQQPPTLRLLSGRLDIGPVVVTNLYHDRLKLETDLALEDLKIDRLLQRIWPHSVGGALSGRLDPLRFQNDTLSSRGTLTADLFNGSVQIIDPGISGLMTSVPVLTFDSRINDLDLEQMTSETTFGKIQGVLRGRLDGVEVVNGQPQKFDLRLETVAQKGVKQEINLRAVENIARLGGGGSPFMGLAGSFAMIFKEFPYWKIGIAASLQNDVFRVNGTILEDGKEYLVKKSGFSGVDVVNLNPNNWISFKDMLKRIKRISDSGDGPVIR
ncbi:MAG: hypothetical protein U5R30_15750 [Deltaproteobacteria bacterium]|nr:hypothetical protein [Deltaproteobacteria bacterium]